MLAHTTPTVVSVLIAAGILFQLQTSARVGARYVRNLIRRCQKQVARTRAPKVPPKTNSPSNRGCRPRRNYRAALRAVRFEGLNRKPR